MEAPPPPPPKSVKELEEEEENQAHDRELKELLATSKLLEEYGMLLRLLLFYNLITIS